MKTFNFTLDKMAKKTGGDKYTNQDENWSIYVPQSLSRDMDGNVADTVTLHIHDNDGIEFSLKKEARKSGADRYFNEEVDFDIYIPQSLTRTDGVVSDMIYLSMEVF